MRFAVHIPSLTRFPALLQDWQRAMSVDDLRRTAGLIDDLGFDEIIIPEHVGMSARRQSTMGGYWPDALTAMAYLAGVTRRVRVGSGMMILPLHPPVQLAKAVSTLDVLSGGRVSLGVGLGSEPEEYAACGVDWSRRGAIMDEHLGVLKAIWGGMPLPVGSERLEGLVFEPGPVQAPHPPLWIGGHSSAALRRAVRDGDGWAPFQLSVDELERRLARLIEEPSYHRRARPLEVAFPVLGQERVAEGHQPLASNAAALGSLDPLIEAVDRLRVSGVTRVSLYPPILDSFEAYLDHLRQLAEALLPRFRAAPA